MTQEAAIIHLSLPSKQALTRLFNIGVHYIFKEVGLRVHAPDPFRGAFYFISKEEDKATPTISLVEWSKLCIVVVLLFYVIIVLLLSFANNVALGGYFMDFCLRRSALLDGRTTTRSINKIQSRSESCDNWRISCPPHEVLMVWLPTHDSLMVEKRFRNSDSRQGDMVWQSSVSTDTMHLLAQVVKLSQRAQVRMLLGAVVVVVVVVDAVAPGHVVSSYCK
jgi:hypothetical protein